MNLSAKNLAILLAAILANMAEATAPKAAYPHRVGYYDEDGFHYTNASVNSNEPPRTANDHFTNYGQILTYYPPFDEAASLKNMAALTATTRVGPATALVRYLTDCGTSLGQDVDHERARALVPKLPEGVFSAVTDKGVCITLGYLGDYMTNKQMSSLKPTCLAAMIERHFGNNAAYRDEVNSTTGERVSELLPRWDPKTIGKVEKSFWKDNAEALLSSAAFFPLEQFKSLIEDHEVCGREKAIGYIVSHALMSKEHGAAISPACWAEIKLKDGQYPINPKDKAREVEMATKVMRHLPNNILTKQVHGMPEALTNCVSKEQAKVFASDVADADDPCNQLKLQWFNKHVVGHLPARCIVGAFKTAKGKIPLKEGWRSLPEETFAKLEAGDVEDLMAKIDNADWQYISHHHINNFLKHEKMCEDLPLEAVRHVSGIEVGKACFKAMKPEVQANVFFYAEELPDDILAGLTYDQLSSWSVGGKYSKGDVVIRGTHRWNAKQILENLGRDAKDDEEHPCRNLDAGQLENSKLLQEAISGECMRVSGINLEGADKEKFHKRLFDMVPFGSISADEWPKMTKERMQAMVAAGAICADFTLEAFRTLPGPAAQAINGKCLNVMRSLPSFDKNDLGRLAPAAARDMTATQAATIHDRVPDAFYGQLSADVKDATLAYATHHVTHDTVKNWSDARLTAVAFWCHVPAAAFEAITDARIGKIKPENMKCWTLEQAEKCKGIGKLSAAQMATLGLDHAGTDKDPMLLFKKNPQLLKSLSSDARKAWKDRSAATNMVVTAMTGAAIAALATIVMLS